jgi:hypothetical protein
VLLMESHAVPLEGEGWARDGVSSPMSGAEGSRAAGAAGATRCRALQLSLVKFKMHTGRGPHRIVWAGLEL